MPDFPCIPDPAQHSQRARPKAPERAATPASPPSTPSPPTASPASPAGVSLRSAAGLLALQQFPGIGAKGALRLAMLAAELDPFLDEHARLWTAELARAEAEVDRCRSQGIAVLSIFDDGYPQRLRALEGPPPVLFVKGALQALASPRTVAIAGSRKPTAAGLAATEEILAAPTQSTARCSAPRSSRPEERC